jgi:hypothetical protein
MDNINSRCNTATEEYKQKYDKLLSLVNGYEVANNSQNESMKSLADIISNTKELISESEFESLKNEQKSIMKDFTKLEEMKNEPYSDESIDFINNKSNPKRFMEETIEEEEEEKRRNNKSNPKRFMEETIEEEEEKRRNNKSNSGYNNNENIKKSIKNDFFLDSLNNIKNKNNNAPERQQNRDNQRQKNNNEPERQQNRDNQRQQNRNDYQSNELINSNNKKILQNYYSDSGKKYDVFSNFQQGNMQPQMPTIQIVNVQESPKENEILKKQNKKEQLKKNVVSLLENSLTELDNKKHIKSQKIK